MDAFDLYRFHAAQSEVSWHLFRVEGSDAGEFLQNQTTGEVAVLKPEQFNVQCFVDRVGKIEAHFYLQRKATHFELYCPVDLAKAVQNRFERFVVSEDVTLVDHGVVRRWVVLGPETPMPQGQFGGEPCALREDLLEGVAQRTLSEMSAFLRWQGEPTLDRPYHTGELINQTRLFDVSVSLKKGCFPGQETVAKVHHNRGAAWAPVLLLVTPGEGPVPSEIVIEDKKLAKIEHQEVLHEKRWCTAEVLRDVRVEGLELRTPHGQTLMVHPYPMFATSPSDKAQHLFYEGTDEFNRGREELALELWQRAIHLHPSYADPYEAMGVLLGRQNRYDEAIGWMKRLLGVDSTSVMAHTNLSLFLMKQGKIQEAEDHKSLATVASFAAFGREAQMKQAQEAERKKKETESLQREQMFLQVLEIDPEDPLANYGLAGLALERGQLAEARQLFETVLKSDPHYSVAYLGLGKVLSALGEKAAAKEIWEQGVKTAAKKGELMPANEMQGLIARLG